MRITSLADPIHDDFYSLVGRDIVPDAVLEFTTAAGVIDVNPDFVRPHLALVARLPTSLPVGPCDVRLKSSFTAPSNVVSVTVFAGPPQVVRLLQPGEVKPRPYTIVFVANPGIERRGGAGFVRDPILNNRPPYHDVVGHCFRNLFGVAEDLLTRGNFDARLRIVSVVDPTRPADAANSLAAEYDVDGMMTRRAVLAPFLNTFGLVADIVFVIYGSSTRPRASAWATSDDPTLASTTFDYDGVSRRHGHYPRVPGSAAIPFYVSRGGMTVIHEYAHAASGFDNGFVFDLYHDGNGGYTFLINKKFRARAGDPVPSAFATYNRTSFASDPTRDALGYEPGWRSYHSELMDAVRPNLMDDFTKSSNQQLCKLDRLTYAWLCDRLDAKLNR